MTHCHTIIQQLRRRGYRITPQREMVIQIIAHTDRHMSAEEIYTKIQKQTNVTNIATVYRTLEMLWEEGFACRNDLSEGKIVYATHQHGPHIHLVCRQCDSIIDADRHILDSFGEELLSQHGFHADLEHISVFGLCKACEEQLNEGIKEKQ